MLSNPVAHALFPGTGAVVGGVLGAALLVLLIVERRHLRDLPHRTLFRRWWTWALIAPTYALAVLAGPFTTALLVVGLSLQGLREYASLVDLPRDYRLVLLVLGAVAAPAALLSREWFYALPPALLLLSTLQPLFFRAGCRDGGGDARVGVRHLAFAVLGWAYLAWLLSFTVIVRTEVGAGLLLVVGLAVALSDVGAFTVGSALGRHRLAPRLSPNKTWEGLGGNLLGALAGVAMMQFAWPPTVGWPLALLLAALIGLGAAWGDLVESAIKREFGAKDAGAWLLGFGGLLDRIDSFVIAVPLAYYAMRLAAAR